MVLALDLDGTLLSDQGTVSGANKAALKAAMAGGIQPTIATGRIAHNRVNELVEELTIRVPYATLNGGVIMAPTGEVLHSFPIPPDDIRWLLAAADADGLDYWVCTLDRVIRKADVSESDLRCIINATFRARTPSDMAQFRCKVETADLFNLTWPDDQHVVANAKDVNKGTALKVICQKIGLTAKDAAAIGDGINDFEMLAWAEYSFAMGNAIDALKGVAKETTVDCHNNGVATAIARLLQMRPLLQEASSNSPL